MAIRFGIKSNSSQIAKLLRKAARDNPRAAALALNRTANTVRSAAVKSIAADIGVKQKIVRKGLFKIKRATVSRLTAEIPATGKRIPVIDLSARQTGQGVTYQHGRQRETIIGAFIARMRSGHTGVFKRRGTTRLPIDERFGPSIGFVLLNRQIQRTLRTVVSDRFPKEFHRAVTFLRRKAV